MTYQSTCKECQTSFTAQRKTRTFCSQSCQVNFFQKQKRRQAKIQQLQQQIAQLTETLSSLNKDVYLLRCHGNLIQDQCNNTQARIRTLQAELGKDLTTWQQEHTTFGTIAGQPNPPLKGWVGVGIAVAALALAPQQIHHKKQQLQTELQQQQQQQANLEDQLRHQRSRIDTLQQQMGQVTHEKVALEQTLARLQLAEQRSLSQQEPSPDPIQAATVKPGEDGVGALDFLQQTFHTFRLADNLGKFMGDLERHMLFITLIGDPGAGKSTLTMHLAQKFDQAGFRVIFFSLELGRSKPLRDMIRRYPPSNRFRIVCSDDALLQNTTPLDAIRQSALHYEVILIDSFGKLHCKTEDLDQLRKDFPETIFLSIAQKTTTGGIRGGAAVGFDSSMVINVVKEEDKETGKIKRVALMQKSRYGTQDAKYYIEEDRFCPA